VSTYSLKKFFLGFIVLILCLSALVALMMIFHFRDEVMSDVAIRWFIFQTFIADSLIFFIMGIPFIIGAEMYARKGKRGFRITMGISFAILAVAYTMFIVSMN